MAHISLSGSQVRFRLINYPSTTPVTFSHLVAAVRTTGLDVDPATQRVVTVHGATAITLPGKRSDITTDPVSLPVQRGQDVTLSIAAEPRRLGALALLELAVVRLHSGGGRRHHHVASGLPFSQRSEDRWLSEVQVLPQAPVPTLAVYGDSITDGLFLPVDTAARWTDQLEAQTDGRLVALNFGVSGDRITGQAPAGQLPPRVATDVFAPRRGICGHGRDGQQRHQGRRERADILTEIRLLAAQVAARHETFIVATVPGRGDGMTAADEQQRQLLNQGLRQYPIVADIDAALTDPATGIIRAGYDAGDHIHPNPLGVAAMTAGDAGRDRQGPGSTGDAADRARVLLLTAVPGSL